MSADTLIALPAPIKVMVGEVEHSIPKFKLGKSLLVLERMTQLLEDEKVIDTLNSGANLGPALAANLPYLLRVARPKVFELLALILVPSKELKDLEDDGEGKLDAKLKKLADDLYDDADLDAAFAILEAGIDQMGVDTLVKNAKSLLAKYLPKKA